MKIKADTEKKHEGELGGMKVSGINWDGTDNDGPCRISLSFIDIGADQVITLLYWGSVEAEKEHAGELQGILGLGGPSCFGPNLEPFPPGRVVAVREHRCSPPLPGKKKTRLQLGGLKPGKAGQEPS